MIAFILTVSLAASPGADPANPRADADADAEYRAGLDARDDSAKATPHFLRAAVAYEATWDTDARTPALARNMAQSRYLAGDLGGCIRDYRRGLRVFPHDPDLRAGLAFAREQVAYAHVGDIAEAARSRDADTWLDRLPISFAQMTGIAITVAAIGWVALARAWIAGRGGLTLFGAMLVLVAVLAGGWLAWQDNRIRAGWAEPFAIVNASGTDLRTGNSDEYPRRLDGRLPAGVELQVLGERGGWLHVELAGGAIGWVAKDRVIEVD